MIRKTTAYALLVFVTFAGTGCMRSTGPTEVGVLVKKLSLFGKSGVQTETYAPGSTFIVWPFVTDWYTFDTRLQNVEMVAESTRGDRPYQDDLKFKTIDGNDIGLDVIVTYRIKPDQAPNILQNVAKSDQELKDRIVRTICRSVARDIFGELKTEEFYIAGKRDEKAEAARKRLNEMMEEYGLVIERVSTKDYRFNHEYQQAIEEKKVADQQAEKFKSETQASAEEYLRKLEQAKGQVAQMTAKADGEFKKAKIDADAYFAQMNLRAQAIRAEGEAEAKGIQEMNKALAGAGGEVMVKMRMAEALLGKQILLLPSGSGGIDLKSTNINKLLEVYGAEQLAKDTAVPAPSQTQTKTR